MRRLANGMATGINLPKTESKTTPPSPCDVCLTANHDAKPYPSSKRATNAPMQLLHCDLSGPFPTSATGKRYVAAYLDDYSGYSHIDYLAHKSDIADTLPTTVARLEKLFNRELVTIRTDNGGEYINDTLDSYFADRGIHHETTAP